MQRKGLPYNGNDEGKDRYDNPTLDKPDSGLRKQPGLTHGDAQTLIVLLRTVCTHAPSTAGDDLSGMDNTKPSRRQFPEPPLGKSVARSTRGARARRSSLAPAPGSKGSPGRVD